VCAFCVFALHLGLTNCTPLPRSLQLRAAIEKKHGDKYSVVLNDPALLKSLSPSGNWRRGAFEVVRTDTNEVLYSKLQTGSHLVDGISDKLDKFVAGL
jgi:hypothetical protein